MAAIASKSITIGISDQLVDGPKNSRDYVGIQNLDGSNDIFIGFGGAVVTAGASANGVRIGPGEFFELKVPGNGSQIRGIAANAPVNIVFLSDS